MNTIRRAKPTLVNGLSEGHYFGIKHYKARKFGHGALAWRAFEEWVQEQFGLNTPVETWTDRKGKAVIEAMKLLHDAPPEGQGVLL